MNSNFLEQTISFWEKMSLPFDSQKLQETQEKEASFPPSSSSSSLSLPVSPPLPLDLPFLTRTFQEWQRGFLKHPETLQAYTETLTRSFLTIFENTWESISDPTLPPVVTPQKGDSRFEDTLWETTPWARLFSQTYLQMGACVLQLLKTSELEESVRQQIGFWIQQWLSAVSPSNHPFINPEVLAQAIASNGQTLRRGFEFWIEDWQKSPKEAFLSLTRPEGFSIGKNLAMTPGKVVFQNDLMQLIHYEPRASQVLRPPLLIVPPWINKFYLFDMRPENSFVKWALENGHAVFMISWVNPNQTTLHQTFESYLLHGFMPALEAVLQISQSPRANLMGLCVGGNLLACALAYLKAKKQDVVQTATFLATLMDFHEVGDLGVFLSPHHFDALKSFIEEKGFMDGHLMALTFSLLRVQEMIWGPLVKRYFFGESPPSLDFLFWNSDPMRIAGPLHLFFLENFFQKNVFKKQGGIKVGDVFCPWHDVTVPRFTLASYKDHIAPWKACFPFAWSEEDEFILSTSGHIAGVINPPIAEKYGYWIGEKAQNPEAWLQSAQQKTGSWWPHWQQWIAPLSGEWIHPQSVGSSPLFPPQEDAPGSYVKQL